MTLSAKAQDLLPSSAEQVMMQKLQFFKNLAIVGGLFGFAAFGGGRFSIDAKRG